jgi:A/G-specific adenine glycosylase
LSTEFPIDKLLDWFDENKREMPWRKSEDPYHIWVSEVMLQQTRVDQARPYFDRFIDRFPTIFDLAEAPQQEVLKVWEGLGYYSRARNLHHAAQTVVEKYNGELPDQYEEISELKGVGPYTAAAVLSIAFNKPHAAVDGNIIRVLSRYYGIEKDIRSTTTRRQIQELADELIDRDRPGDFNQALMDFGAMVCTARDPYCLLCPMREFCKAFHDNPIS